MTLGDVMMEGGDIRADEKDRQGLGSAHADATLHDELTPAEGFGQICDDHEKRSERPFVEERLEQRLEKLKIGNVLSDALSNCKPIYILPREDAANAVIVPAMAASQEVSIMMGFFSSGAFAQIAPGLAAFLDNSSESLRLIISPFISESDQEALRNGLLNAESFAADAVESLLPSADDLANHTLGCLAWLISADRLRVRIGLMKDALFHPKTWLFRNVDACAALHGSANMTGQGLRGNREQLSLARSWINSEAQQTFDELSAEFEVLWSGGDDHCVTLDLSDAISARIVRDFKGNTQPTEDDFRRIWRRAHGLSDEPIDLESLLAEQDRGGFTIPDWLEFRTGNYAHQGRAIDAWNAQNYRGILEMCTGSGKTLTALAAAQLLREKVGPLLIVVAAPYNVLVAQWCDEIRLFGVQPINITDASGRVGRARELAEARRRLRRCVSDSEAIVVSNDTLCTSEFQGELQKFKGRKLLIADECHNLGSASFISNPPDFSTTAWDFQRRRFVSMMTMVHACFFPILGSLVSATRLKMRLAPVLRHMSIT